MADETGIPEPQPPNDDECCGGGACCPCVWDSYYERRRIWLAHQAERKKQQAADACGETESDPPFC
jgi:hypothetical protein